MSAIVKLVERDHYLFEVVFTQWEDPKLTETAAAHVEKILQGMSVEAVRDLYFDLVEWQMNRGHGEKPGEWIDSEARVTALHGIDPDGNYLEVRAA